MEGFPWWLRGKEVTCNAGHAGDESLIPGSGRFPGGGNGNPLQFSCLENSTVKGSLTVYSLGSQRVGHDWAHICVMYGNQRGVGGNGEYRPTTMDWYIFAQRDPGVGNKGRPLTTWDWPHVHGVGIYHVWLDLLKRLPSMICIWHGCTA